MSIAFGFAAAAASWIILIALAVLFAGIYIPTILSEEAYLREHFAGFDSYAQQVPRLLPRLRPAHPNPTEGGFSAALYRKHREYNSLMGAAAIYAVLALKFLLERHMLHAGLSKPIWWP